MINAQSLSINKSESGIINRNNNINKHSFTTSLLSSHIPCTNFRSSSQTFQRVNYYTNNSSFFILSVTNNHKTKQKYNNNNIFHYPSLPLPSPLLFYSQQRTTFKDSFKVLISFSSSFINEKY